MRSVSEDLAAGFLRWCRSNWSFAVVAAAAFLVGYMVTSGRVGPVLDVDVDLVSNRPEYDQTRQWSERGQLMFLLFGSSTCGFSNASVLPSLIRRAKALVAEQGSVYGLGFMTVGVALDWSIEDGRDFLDGFGRFDEVSVGYSWSNSMALEYIWQQRAEGTTPQVLVVYRKLESPATDSIARIRVKKQNVVVRKAGLTAIKTWVERRAPVKLDKIALQPVAKTKLE